MTSETTRIDPATIDLADDEPDDLDRYIATLSRTDPELPAWLDAQLARDARRRRGTGTAPGSWPASQRWTHPQSRTTTKRVAGARGPRCAQPGYQRRPIPGA